MSERQRIHKWYIEPLDKERANETLSKNQWFLSDDDNRFDEIVCSDGERHNLWGCPDYAFVSILEKRKSE